jgi:hypothetical protein
VLGCGEGLAGLGDGAGLWLGEWLGERLGLGRRDVAAGGTGCAALAVADLVGMAVGTSGPLE